MKVDFLVFLSREFAFRILPGFLWENRKTSRLSDSFAIRVCTSSFFAPDCTKRLYTKRFVEGFQRQNGRISDKNPVNPLSVPEPRILLPICKKNRGCEGRDLWNIDFLFLSREFSFPFPKDLAWLAGGLSGRPAARGEQSAGPGRTIR